MLQNGNLSIYLFKDTLNCKPSTILFLLAEIKKYFTVEYQQYLLTVICIVTYLFVDVYLSLRKLVS